MNVRLIIQKGFVAVLAALTLGSCDAILEDRDDCPTGLYVNFVYDYNIQRADMLKDHVGGLTLYVYDESDRLVASKSMSGSQLSKYGNYMHFTEAELAPGHDYRLMAVAFQTDMLSATGAKYRQTANSKGDQWQQFRIDLDHTATRAAANYYYVSNIVPLDTLWHTLTTLTTPAEGYPMQLAPVMLTPAKTKYHLNKDGSISTNGQEKVTLVKDEPTYATVSLIRDTNHLNISLREIDHPEKVNHEDYDVTIIDDNSAVDYMNNVIAPNDSIVYTPYAQWTSKVESDGKTTADCSAHYDLMFNRLRYNPIPSNNATLCIRKRATGETVALFNLPYILCEGRMAYEIYNYQPQEYLDREYDYRLELWLKGERWQEGAFLTVCIDVLSWAKRIQYVSF